MSKGAFLRTAKYEASAGNGGEIHPIRIQPETLTLTFGSASNASPTGAVSSNIPVSVSGGSRSARLVTRRVSFAFVTAPSGYKQDSVISLPWLNPVTFATLTKNSVGTYTVDGTPEDVVLVGKTPEYPVS